MPSALPIDDVLPAVVAGLRDRGSVVLRAPTGAGKSTRVPPAILQSGLVDTPSPQRIIMLEPRRIAARTTARRIADELGVQLGREVGYCVRFDELASRDTRILIVTEGILLRQLQSDPFLEGVGAVLFDEFHERNLNSDLALGMLRRVRETVRPDLQLVVMSATLDPAPIAAFLGDSAIVESEGRTFPVDIRYLPPRERLHPADLAVWGVQSMIPKTNGDVLVFLPGVGEIRRAERELSDFARREQLALRPLFGDLPPAEQDAALAPCAQRKVILATNVAETSLTIEGITVVIDTGCAKVLRFDPQAGLDRLVLEPVSQASADQRAGRAGRTQPGVCVRLWDAASQRGRPERDTPEVRRVDLAGPVLQLRAWGEEAILNFPWFEPPRTDAVEQAELLLRRLGALTDAGAVTSEGQEMALLPIHPRLARLLIDGSRAGQGPAAAWLAALLSERDPFMRAPRSGSRGPIQTTTLQHSPSDLLDRLQALVVAERSGQVDFPWGTLNRNAARNIAQVRDQLARLLRDQSPTPTPSDASPHIVLLRSLVAAFPDRVARRRDVGSDRGLMVGGKGVKLAPQSSVRQGHLFLCVDVDGATSDALVRQASAVEPDWLPAASLRTVTEVFFHPSQKQVVARQRTYFEDLILSEAPTTLPTGEAAAEVLFAEAVKAWDRVFPIDDKEIAGFVTRVQCLAEWMPELELPAFDQPSLQRVLRSLCDGCRSFVDLRQAEWLQALKNALTWPQLQAIEREAPEHLQVPSGSRIRLTYETGRPPVLAVRIQEVFGLTETPRIAGGRAKVLLHLLAPNQRPQQVTDDLASFWTNTYAVVRKELARRYPKHSWPENPLQAPPTARAKPRST
ncbi:MAG: ATP-dependent helicase HrpB [Planctomycetaceae bacterium]